MTKETLRTLLPVVLLLAVPIVGVTVLLLMRDDPRTPMVIPRPPVEAPVYLVGIGDIPAEEINGLVAHYREKLDLPITVLPTIPVPAEAFDQSRQQVVAEALIDTIGRSQAAVQDPAAIVIGLTSSDMYIAAREWNYAYSLRAGDRFAVVSTARMGDGWFVDEARRMQRIRKMVTKNIGVLYYRLPQSDDPGSVMYRNILGPQDLDKASEDF